MLRPGLRLVCARELRRMRRRRFYLALLVVLPLGTWFVLTSVFAQRVVRELPLAVIDQDHSALARRVIRALDASAGLDVQVRADAIDAESILQGGEAYGVVVIPRGLERRMLRGEPLPVALLYNAQLPLPSNLVLREVRTAVGTISVELDARSRAVREGALRARVSADPIRTELHPLYNPSLDYAAFLYLALLPAVFHVFVLMATIDAVGRELRERTALVWLRSSGGSTARALLGKLLPCTVWFTAFGTILLALSIRRLGLRVEGSAALLLLGAMLFVLAYQAVGVMLVCFTANLRLALTAGAFLAGPSFVVAGVTFPLLAMPLAGRAWAAALPLTHYLAVQVGTVIADVRPGVLLPSLAALALFVVAGVVVAAWRLPRLLRSAEYWGRT